jgi:hypothetical protein
MTSGNQPARGRSHSSGARGDSDLCRARLVRPGRLRGTGPCPSTACACLAALWRAASSAQSPPYDVDPKRELAPKLPNSNRQLETIRNSRNPFKIRQMTFSNEIIYLTQK